MKQIILAYAAFAFLLASCNNVPGSTTIDKGERLLRSELAKDSDSLVYEGPTISSYTEQVKRGSGVISFDLAINDRLDILNMDNTKFGDIVLNEDLTYFTLNMPKKIIARKLVPEYDFAAFDFDAENVEADKEYLIVYVNKDKRKVRKSDVKFVFNSWK